MTDDADPTAPVPARRTRREQQLVETLALARRRVDLRELGEQYGVSERTIERDVLRLQHAGVPIRVVRGAFGGVELQRPDELGPVHLEFDELAALLASVTALGPNASDSARSAMAKLTAALRGD